MSFIHKLKKRIILRSIAKRKRNSGFDAAAAELYTIPDGADAAINNSYYFSAHDASGVSLFARLGLRGDGSSEVWFAYKDKNTFLSAKNELYRKGEETPLKVSCVKPAEEWEFSFDGNMADLNDKGKKELPVKYKGRFTASLPVFDFFYHMNPSLTADAMASEKWNGHFFDEVNKNNQVHHEQQGKITGAITIDGRTTQWESFAIRDHSYGKRDWSYMDRHLWFMALLEDGTAVNISMVKYPVLKLLSGNMGGIGKNISMTRVTLPADIINNGKGPDEVTVNCLLEDGRELSCFAKRDVSVEYRFHNGSYILHEGIGDFIINGKKARGIMEFGFNSDKSRW